MPHFVYDNETIATKSNQNDLPVGADPLKYISAEDMNALAQDLVDLREGITGWPTGKNSVRAATTGAISLTGTQTIDGVSLVAGDRVLVKDQGDAKTNGIYVVAAGAWARSTDANLSAEVVSGLVTQVIEGTTLIRTQWMLTTSGAIVLDTTPLAFTQMGSATRAFGEIAQQTNVSATTISDTTNFFTVNLSAPTLSTLESQFDNSSGHRLRYTGSTTKTFAVSAVYISTGGSTLPSVIMFRISKNGTEIAKSENAIRVSTATGEHGSAQVLVSLATNDYLELEVRNFTAVSNVTVTYVNLRAIEA
jgi:phage-related tail fiber protein